MTQSFATAREPDAVEPAGRSGSSDAPDAAAGATPDSKTAARAASNGIAIVFPGQGSQSRGMAGKLLRIYPGAEARFRGAQRILGYDLFHLIEEGSEQELGDTWHSQPAIYTASIAWYEALQKRWHEAGRASQPVVAMAGHSLGQISAAVAAGALDFEDGLHLVKERARLMRDANHSRPGGMASIIGLRDRVLRAIVGEAAEADTLVVANDNCPGHSVVSGDESALGRVMRLAEEKGARRVVRLPISIASHSPLMDGAQAQFREVVNAMPWRDPQVPLVSNITAGFILTREALMEELNEALCKPVRWTDSVKAMVAAGSDVFVEAGPGDVLSKLVRRIARTAWTFPVSDDDEGLAQRDYPDMSTGIPK